MNTKAHEVIEVPPADFRRAYPHIQAVLRRADAIEKFDHIVIPSGPEPDPAAGRPVGGLTYEVHTSTTTLRPPGWVLMAFGATIMRWPCSIDEKFWVRVEHDAATCEYCLFRTRQSIETIDRLHTEGRSTAANEFAEELELLRGVRKPAFYEEEA